MRFLRQTGVDPAILAVGVRVLAIGFLPVHASVDGNASYDCGSGFVHNNGNRQNIDSEAVLSYQRLATDTGTGTPSQVCPIKVHNRRDLALWVGVTAIVVGFVTVVFTSGPRIGSLERCSARRGYSRRVWTPRPPAACTVPAPVFPSPALDDDICSGNDEGQASAWPVRSGRAAAGPSAISVGGGDVRFRADSHRSGGVRAVRDRLGCWRLARREACRTRRRPVRPWRGPWCKTPVRKARSGAEAPVTRWRQHRSSSPVESTHQPAPRRHHSSSRGQRQDPIETPQPADHTDPIPHRIHLNRSPFTATGPLRAHLEHEPPTTKHTVLTCIRCALRQRRPSARV